MRPPDLRHSSMARSSAQSECWELATGTNTSRYTGSSLAREQTVKLKSEQEMQKLDAQTHSGVQGTEAAITLLTAKPLCVCAPSLWLSWYQLPAICVPYRDRIYRTGIARAQQLIALDRLRLHEYRHAVFVQLETFGRRLHAVGEPDAQGAIDADPQPVDDPLLEAAHIPSSPSSARAVSMTAGVISGMACCRA